MCAVTVCISTVKKAVAATVISHYPCPGRFVAFRGKRPRDGAPRKLLEAARDGQSQNRRVAACKGGNYQFRRRGFGKRRVHHRHRPLRRRHRSDNPMSKRPRRLRRQSARSPKRFDSAADKVNPKTQPPNSLQGNAFADHGHLHDGAVVAGFRARHAIGEYRKPARRCAKTRRH